MEDLCSRCAPKPLLSACTNGLVEATDVAWTHHVGGLSIRRPGSRHLPVGRLGRHLAQDLPVGTVEAPIRDLLPMSAGGIVHGVIEPPAASLPRGYHQGEPLPC